MSDTSCTTEMYYIVNQSIVKWKLKEEKLHYKIITLYELIDIRGGAQ